MAILKKPGTPSPANAKVQDRLPGLPKDNGGDGVVDETPAPAKKPLAKQIAATPKVDAFASRFNSTEASAGGGFVPPPPGQYEILITEAQGERVEGGKECAYLVCTIVNNDDIAGKEVRIYFNFTDDDGNEAAGMPYFKQALAMCGFEDEITSWNHMLEVIAAIATEQLWGIMDVKKKGKWTNCFLSSIFEDQKQKPELPQ